MLNSDRKKILNSAGTSSRRDNFNIMTDKLTSEQLDRNLKGFPTDNQELLDNQRFFLDIRQVPGQVKTFIQDVIHHEKDHHCPLTVVNHQELIRKLEALELAALTELIDIDRGITQIWVRLARDDTAQAQLREELETYTLDLLVKPWLEKIRRLYSLYHVPFMRLSNEGQIEGFLADVCRQRESDGIHTLKYQNHLIELAARSILTV